MARPKETDTEIIKRRIRIAKRLRDEIPDRDIQSWHFYNGMVTALEDLIAERCGKKFDDRFARKG